METYLFDFDGTLVDSMPTYISAVLQVLDSNGIPYGDDLVKIITPLGLSGTAKYFMSLGLDMPEAEIMEQMRANMLHGYFHTIPAKSNVIPVLKTLREKGADLNILTASPHVTLDVCLKRLGIYDLFTHVWSCDDFATTKTDPQIYKMAAARIGKAVDEILFLDDNVNADRTAKQAGMKVCGVYDESSRDYVEEMRAVCDGYIYDFEELLEMKWQTKDMKW